MVELEFELLTKLLNIRAAHFCSAFSGCFFMENFTIFTEICLVDMTIRQYLEMGRENEKS